MVIFFLSSPNKTEQKTISYGKLCDYSRHHECCELSPTPDEAVFRNLASVYASNHPEMRTGNNCNETFPGGITNGAFWYELNGECQTADVYLTPSVNLERVVYISECFVRR